MPTEFNNTLQRDITTVDCTTLQPGDEVRFADDGRFGGLEGIGHLTPGAWYTVQSVNPRVGTGHTITLDEDEGTYGFEWFDAQRRPADVENPFENLDDGAHVRVLTENGDENYGGHLFVKGEVVKFAKNHRGNADITDGTFFYLDEHDFWFLGRDEFEVVPPTEPAPLPTIDFSVDRYATAREYAAGLSSRVNKDETNTVLDRIAEGHIVAAHDVIDILPDVFSGATTRISNSQGRRDQAKRIRHLAYIANAVVRNHAEGLPTYEPGERSPALRDANETIRRLEHEAESLKSHVGEATTEVEAATRRLMSLQADYDRLNGVLANNQDLLQDSIAERAVLQDTLDYAIGQGDEKLRHLVVGFEEGRRRA